jgi:hypothetical protein
MDGPRTARREALRRFGGEESTKEWVRRAGGRLLLDLIQEIRQGCRRLARSPRFALTAVAVLAVGVGTTTAMFSIVDSVYLDDLPHIVDSGDLVRIHGVDDRAGAPVALPYPDFA